MTVAIGLELSTETDMAAIAVAASDGGRWLADLVFYGSPDDAAGKAAGLYEQLEDNCGVYLDPLPCSGVLDGLRAAGLWLHELGPEDVAASAWQFTTEVRARRVRLGSHPALRESMRAAVPRPLAVRFAFERKRVTADMSPLNASAFALWGLRKNEAAADAWRMAYLTPRQGRSSRVSDGRQWDDRGVGDGGQPPGFASPGAPQMRGETQMTMASTSYRRRERERRIAALNLSLALNQVRYANALQAAREREARAWARRAALQPLLEKAGYGPHGAAAGILAEARALRARQEARRSTEHTGPDCQVCAEGRRMDAARAARSYQPVVYR